MKGMMYPRTDDFVTTIIPLHDKFLQFDWLRAVVFQLNLKYLHLLYRHECFTGKNTTRKIHKNYIRDPSGLFSIISQVSLPMT